MLNKSKEVILEGFRFSDNYYKLIHSHTCHTTSLDNIDLWHQKLGHLNFKNLSKIVNTSVVRKIHPLRKKKNQGCVDHARSANM